MFRILAIAGALLLAAAAIGAGYSVAATDWMLLRHRTAPLLPVSATAGPEDAPEGRRMAILLGCLEGCHGETGDGLTLNHSGVYTLTAPPLGTALADYSDAEAARLLRYGVKKDGRSAILMPAATFYPLSEDDIARVLVHLRSLPRVEGPRRVRKLHWEGRRALLAGEWHVSADEVDPSRPRWGEEPRRTASERGRYLASIICAECHGVDFQGVKFEGSPSLAIAAAYPDEDFHTLMKTGVPLGGRDLGIMSEVARDAFVYFTDEEIADIHAFLKWNFGVEE